jgi:hypothetical protein
MKTEPGNDEIVSGSILVGPKSGGEEGSLALQDGAV